MRTQTKRRLTVTAYLLTFVFFAYPYAGTRAQVISDLSLSITILYFDQSSHQLRPNVKRMLDTIARQLVEQPKLMATVTGYADNVGKRELNMALSKYRTRAVEQYLRQHGVRANQIVASWEGPDTTVSADDPAGVKTIRRRVVVQLSPNY